MRVDLKDLFTNELAEAWLLEQGVISDISKNNLIMGLNVVAPNNKSIEMDIDAVKKLLDIRIFIEPFKLFMMTILFKKEATLSAALEFVDAYLLGKYAVRISLVPYRKK